MPLNSILDFLLFEVLELVLLQEDSDLSATTKPRPFSVRGNREGSSSGGLPDILLIVVVLGHDLNALGDKIGGVKADTELSNHGNVGTGTHSFHAPL